MKSSKPRPLFSRASLMVAAALLAVGTPKPAKAANLFWDTNGTTPGLGGNGTWNTTTANWFNAGGATTTLGDQATIASSFTLNDVAYFAGAVGGSNVVTLGEAITIGGLNFSGWNSYEIAGSSALTLAAPAGAPVQPVVSVALGSRVTATAKISGNQGLLKTGDGTLVLANVGNDFTGDLLIRGGAVVITNSAQLGAGTGPVMIHGISNTGNPGFSGGSLVVQGGIAGINVAREISASGRGPGAANASGAILSVGNNNFTGGVTMGSGSETRFHATPGITTLSGDLSLGSGNVSMFYGDGNFIVAGKIVSYDAGADRLYKEGMTYATSLWIQGDQNRFNGQVRAGSGWVRVTDPTNLGLNRSFQNVDFVNGGLEVRTALNNWSDRNFHFRNNASGNLFIDRKSVV
jgi:autotransporter-associated beta strand protein